MDWETEDVTTNVSTVPELTSVPAKMATLFRETTRPVSQVIIINFVAEQLLIVYSHTPKFIGSQVEH